jgi:hypothetical protein
MSAIDKISMLRKSIPYILMIASFAGCNKPEQETKIETLEDFVKYQANIDNTIQELTIKRDSLKVVFYHKLAIEMGNKFEINRALLYGLWMQESQMNPTVKGDGGKAHGLGQIHLTTARQCFDSAITSAKLMEPITNGEASATYLKQCLVKNKGNIYKGISCYRLGKDSKGMDWEYTAKVLKYATEWRN